MAQTRETTKGGEVWGIERRQQTCGQLRQLAAERAGYYVRRHVLNGRDHSTACNYTVENSTAFAVHKCGTAAPPACSRLGRCTATSAGRYPMQPAVSMPAIHVSMGMTSTQLRSGAKETGCLASLSFCLNHMWHRSLGSCKLRRQAVRPALAASRWLGKESRVARQAGQKKQQQALITNIPLQ